MKMTTKRRKGKSGPLNKLPRCWELKCPCEIQMQWIPEPINLVPTTPITAQLQPKDHQSQKGNAYASTATRKVISERIATYYSKKKLPIAEKSKWNKTKMIRNTLKILRLRIHSKSRRQLSFGQ